MGLTVVISVLMALANAASAYRTRIFIENFENPTHTWTTMDDPVMGGESSSTLKIKDGVANFDGEVAIVPFLNAPGFIQMMTRSSTSDPFPDVSSCKSLQLTLMASEKYTGYRVSFGTVHLPESRHAYGYKADFEPPVGGYDKAVIIPFTHFSSKWNEATGETMVSCEENEDYCPDAATLKDMQTIAIWGEGVEGSVRLSVKAISATDCFKGESSESEPAENMVSASSASSEIHIETFSNPSLTWSPQNDPVMGGKSTSTVEIKDGVGNFDGEVVDVPFLHSPGFIKMVGSGAYPDVSACSSLQMNLMALEDYGGYRVSFGNVHLPEMKYSRGYHADFIAPVGEYNSVVIPFDNFSSKWDPATGDQIVSCQDDSQYCPDKNTLKNMETFAIWGEGVAGTVQLRVKSISAIGCSGEASLPAITTVEKKSATTSSKQASKTSTKTFVLVFFAGSAAALLSVAILNHVRSKGNTYAKVDGTASVNEIV